MECIFQLTAENIDQLVLEEENYPYPAAWFPLSGADFEPPEDWDPTLMNWIGCDGRFISVVAEDGVPFTHSYPDLAAPMAVEADSYYMNHRAERPVPVMTADGLVRRPAGTIGFKHSPDDLETLEAAFEWHDRDLTEGWDGAAMERVLVRARLIEYNEFLLAVGGVVPTLTQGEASHIQNAEISGEFYILRNELGQPRMQIVAPAFVIQGNTRTSASSAERTRRASVRSFDKEAEMPTPAIKKADTDESVPSRTWTMTGSEEVLDRVETLLAAIQWAGDVGHSTTYAIDIDGDGSDRMKLDGATLDQAALGEYLEDLADSGVEPELIQTPTDIEVAGIAALRAENETLRALASETIVVDLTPLRQATIETTDELREALNSTVQETFGRGAGLYAWAMDIDLDLSQFRYGVEDNGVVSYFRDGFAFDAETHQVTLAGASVEVIMDTSWVDVTVDTPPAPATAPEAEVAAAPIG